MGYSFRTYCWWNDSGSGGVNLSSGTNSIDFFFILTGYLTMASCLKVRENSIIKSSLSYAEKRIKRFLPGVWLALFITIIVRVRMYVLYRDFSLSDVFRWLDGIRSEWLMLNSIIWNDDFANGPTWFISAIIIVEIPLFFIIQCFKRAKKIWIFYFFAIVLTSRVYIMYWIQGGYFISLHITRTVVGIGIGIICYGIVELYKNFLKDKKHMGEILSLIEIVSIIGIIKYLWLEPFSIAGTINHCYIFWALLISCNFIGGTWLSKILDNKISAWLGKVSFGIYLIHTAILQYFYFELSPFFYTHLGWMWVCVILCIFIIGVAFYYLVNGLLVTWNKLQLIKIKDICD